MKILALFVLAAASLGAQTLSFTVQPTGAPLPAAYQFADTAVGASTDFIVRVSNASQQTIAVGEIFFLDTTNFSVTGTSIGKVLAPGSTNFEEFTIHFKPSVTGAVAAALSVVYSTQANGCNLTGSNPATQCPSTLMTAATFSGNGTVPQLVVSYTNANGTSSVLRSTDTINFGTLSVSQQSAVTITLANQSSTSITTPPVSVTNAVFASSAFAASASSLPGTIAAGSSATFTLTFAPGQAGLTTATLNVGSSSYPLQGTGIVASDIDALQITYADADGVRGFPQAATPIDFGQIGAGTSNSAALTFAVTNPTTSFNAVTVPNITLSGNGFQLSNVPAVPASIAPGATINFQVTFTPVAKGNYSGTLAIGTRQFALTGLGASLGLPAISLQFDTQTFGSQQQPHLSIQLASAAPTGAIGTLNLQYVSSILNVTDDPAIYFAATGGRNLQVTIASGGTTATYNGQSLITFQTGTTAGTITFTLTFPNTPPITQSIVIPAVAPQLISATGLRQSPNLVVTLSGYDNTYSAGSLLFTFNDTNGAVITPGGISVDATASFKQYFFNNNQAGGAFSLQASFPVTGDVTKVGSVDVVLANGTGRSASQHIVFQ